MQNVSGKLRIYWRIGPLFKKFKNSHLDKHPFNRLRWLSIVEQNNNKHKLSKRKGLKYEL